MIATVHIQVDCPSAEALTAAEASLEDLERACNDCHARTSTGIDENVALLASLKERLELLERRLLKDTRPARESLS